MPARQLRGLLVRPHLFKANRTYPVGTIPLPNVRKAHIVEGAFFASFPILERLVRLRERAHDVVRGGNDRGDERVEGMHVGQRDRSRQCSFSSCRG